MKIVTDTASLLSPAEGREMGVTVIPTCVLVNGEAYRDYEDIDCEGFLKFIENGNIPTSSQPAIGDVLEVFEQNDEDILCLSIGDGLSGTYQTAVGARNCVENNDNIHVVNTKTLAGAQRYIVQKAVKLREEGHKIDEVVKRIKETVETSVSFVIPADFEFLKRSGRLVPFAANIGSVIKIVPVLTQTEDMQRIRLFTIKRTRKRAVEAIIEHLEKMGVGCEHLLFVGHGGAEEAAKEVLAQIRRSFSETAGEILKLAPALITHGGPGCITVQAIHK